MPKKCGFMEGFMTRSLTNEDSRIFHVGASMFRLWQRCDGKRTVDQLAVLMSEENTAYTSSSVKEMLDCLQAKKLINYPGQ